MKKTIALMLVCSVLFLVPLAHAYCGDDICSAGETCKTCIWDCGVCDSEGSGGNIIGTSSGPKTVSIWDGESQYHNCPLAYSSYVSSGNANTSVRIKILNNFSTPTGAFRLSLSSYFSWFVPKNITFALSPDGSVNNNLPFWDVPALGPHQSTEVSFVVNGSVGLVNEINVKADPLDRWKGDCKYFVPISGSSLSENITEYLDSVNQSQKVTTYYEEGNRMLVYLENNRSFAVFEINNSSFMPVLDRNAIEEIVSSYVKAASPQPTTDISKPYKILNYSRILKQGPESNCMRITGMDRFNCTDRTSCRYACASVPVCWYIGQVGWPFIDTMLDYRKTIDKANTTLDQAINSSYEFKQRPSNETALVALTDLDSLNLAETKVVYHPIFTTYNFCPPPEYAIPQQIEAKRQLLDYLEENCVYRQKERIINESFSIAPILQEAAIIAEIARIAAINTNITNQTGANITINGTVNGTINGTTNASTNMTSNITVNVTTNITSNITSNITTNVTGNISGNATGNMTTNASMQNTSNQNVTINANATNASAANGSTTTEQEKNVYVCPGALAPFILMLALGILRPKPLSSSNPLQRPYQSRIRARSSALPNQDPRGSS